MPITEAIPKYEEVNNKCAVDNMDFLRDKMKKWEAQGYIRKVDTKPVCVNPLSVASKMDLKADEMKKQPCLDLS